MVDAARFTTLGGILLVLVIVACLVLYLTHAVDLPLAGLVGFTALGSLLR